VNLWLRASLPALVIFGFGYLVRAADDRDYSTEGLHKVLVIVALAGVVIGILVWLLEHDSSR
jgi:hypothetical protein